MHGFGRGCDCRYVGNHNLAHPTMPADSNDRGSLPGPLKGDGRGPVCEQAHMSAAMDELDIPDDLRSGLVDYFQRGSQLARSTSQHRPS